jgi:antibiotic biosynthesis monooxygenase (ABM) superfamily enzyme
MQAWATATSLVINNLITSSILTWVVMPRLSQLLGFWLRPAYQPTALQTDLMALAWCWRPWD